MRTDFPSVTIRFTFAHTYCRVTVFKAQEAFFREVLKFHRAEFLPDDDPNQGIEWSPALLLQVVLDTLPHLLVLQVPAPYEIVSKAMEGLNLTFKKL